MMDIALMVVGVPPLMGYGRVAGKTSTSGSVVSAPRSVEERS